MPDKRTFRSILLPGVFLLLLAGCKTQKAVPAAEAIRMGEAGEFFERIEQQSFRYQTLLARTTAEMRFQGKELSSRMDLRIVKDSVIQLSFQPFAGVEVFRIEFGRDSVKALDRMNKRYVLESYAGLQGQASAAFNFYNLQALFSNRLFIPGEQKVSPLQYKRFRLKQEGETAEASVRDAGKWLYAFSADGGGKLLSTRIDDPAERFAVRWAYADFRSAEKQLFPMLMNVRIGIDGTPAGEMQMSVSRIQRDIPLNPEFAVPPKYKRVTFAEIIKLITGSK
jgi:hypothetical protein